MSDARGPKAAERLPYGSHRWFDPYRPLLARRPARGATTFPDHAELDAWFESERLARFPDEPPLRFVDCPPRPRRRRGRAAPLDPCRFYDGRITRDREVPTRRANLHDFCNALVWLAFPRSKRALHARQYAALERWIPEGATTVPGRRTREQDALTLFDEGGAVLLSGGRRNANGEITDVVAFGHALLEHFDRQANAIAATALRVDVVFDPDEPTAYDRLDVRIAELVNREGSFLAPGLDALLELDARGHARAVHDTDVSASSS